MKKKRKNINLFVWLTFILFVFFAGLLIFNSNGLITYFKLKGELRTLHKEITVTENQINTLQSKIDSLKTNDFKIEEVAREKYNMQKKNEKVLTVEEK
jgi:cell division protein FtsB